MTAKMMSDSLKIQHLCVDLDDTLILGDSFYHQIKILIAKQPLKLPYFMWLLATGGRPAAKTWLAGEHPIDAATLPYRNDLLTYLRDQKAAGRKLYLVSAANQDTVTRVAAHIGLFDGAHGSNATINLKAAKKADFIQKNIANDFCYAGDALADIAVWKKAQGMILCGKAVRLRNLITTALTQAGRDVPVETCFPDPGF